MRGIKSTVANLIIDVLETIAIALSIFIVIYLLAFQPHEINGPSMDGLANFHDGQFLLTDKLTYRFKSPQRGDVIIFKYPLNDKYDYIKRIIGLPGESIMIAHDKIYIYNKQHPNGFVLDESEYLSPNVYTRGHKFLKEGEKNAIPDGSYFVIGDNREHSSDSREWGFVPFGNIIGKSAFRYWPPNEIGIIRHPDYLQ